MPCRSYFRQARGVTNGRCYRFTPTMGCELQRTCSCRTRWPLGPRQPRSRPCRSCMPRPSRTRTPTSSSSRRQRPRTCGWRWASRMTSSQALANGHDAGIASDAIRPYAEASSCRVGSRAARRLVPRRKYLEPHWCLRCTQVQKALQQASLQIGVTVPLNYSIMANSYPPSAGQLDSKLTMIINNACGVMAATGAPFMITSIRSWMTGTTGRRSPCPCLFISHAESVGPRRILHLQEYLRCIARRPVASPWARSVAAISRSSSASAGGRRRAILPRPSQCADGEPACVQHV